MRVTWNEVTHLCISLGENHVAGSGVKDERARLLQRGGALSVDSDSSGSQLPGGTATGRQRRVGQVTW